MFHISLETEIKTSLQKFKTKGAQDLKCHELLKFRGDKLTCELPTHIHKTLRHGTSFN